MKKQIMITMAVLALFYVTIGAGIACEYWLSNLWHLSFNGMTWAEATIHMLSNPLYMALLILTVGGMIPVISWLAAEQIIEVTEMERT